MRNFDVCKMSRYLISVVFLAGLASACGGSGSSGSDGSGPTPWDVGGSITMSEANQAGGDVVSIIEIPFGKGSRRDLTVGATPWRHQDGTLYYLSNCGERGTYVAVLDNTGTSLSASPCSDSVANAGYSPTKFTYVMASPDQRRVAVEARWYDRELQVHFDTLIYEDNIIIATYEGSYAAAWLDNDTLVFPSGDSLYTASLGREAIQLNSEITGNTNNPDVSPDGTRIVFEWNGAIWLMASNGTNLRQLSDDAQNLRYPVWSPDGQFVAFLRIRSPGAFDHLIIPGDPLNYSYLSNSNERSVHFVQPNTLERWVGSLERHVTNDKMPQGQLSWLPPSR